MNPDLSKLHLKLINSSEHKAGPRLSLPPQSVLQSQAAVSFLSIWPRTIVLLPTQVSVQLQGDGTEPSCQNDSGFGDVRTGKGLGANF